MNHDEIVILCEGKTDYEHLEIALKHFKKKGYYSNLKLDLSDKGYGGWSKLDTYLDSIKNTELARKTIAVFDADVDKILKKYDIDNYDILNPNLFVVISPRPSHIPDGRKFCIEMLYHEKELKLVDSNGCRMYFTEEFNQENGKHLEEKVYTPSRSWDKLIVDEKIFNLEDPSELNTNVNLTKVDFAKVIASKAEADEVEFLGFQKLFDMLYSISNLHKNN